MEYLESIVAGNGFDLEQMEFVAKWGGNHRNKEEMQALAKHFKQRFGVSVAWKEIRRLVTKINRKRKRNGVPVPSFH